METAQLTVNDRPLTREAPSRGSAAGRALLTKHQIKVLARYGESYDVAESEILFRAGDDTYDLFVVLLGEVEIIEHYKKKDKEIVLASYGSKQFLGEMGCSPASGYH
jgi:CRP-like cAMP-binding protein